MEVFLRNVPQELTEESLTTQLQPFINALGIRDWGCDKPRKRKLAWLTFLYERDGCAFLDSHGKIPGHRDIPRLRLLSTNIFVERSTRPVDKHHLSHLKEKSEKSTRSSKKDQNVSSQWFEVQRLGCGVNVFLHPGEEDRRNHIEASSDGGRGQEKSMYFAEQTDTSDDGMRVKFGRHSLSLTFTAPIFLWPSYQMDVHYATLQDLIAGEATNSLTLVLSEPPKFYEQPESEEATLLKRALHLQPESGDATKFKRTLHLQPWGWYQHASFVETCLVYRLSIAPESFSEALRILRANDTLSISRYELPMYQPHHQWDQSNREAKHEMESGLLIESLALCSKEGVLPFAILFQIEALFRNNYLRPASACQMLEELKQAAQSAKDEGVALELTTESMKSLFQRIPYPCAGTDSEELDVKVLIKGVMNHEVDLRNQDSSRHKVYGSRLPNNQAWILKAMVTPTRILLHGPDPESKNRVLRMFPKHNDHFLRVTFCEEDGQDLSLTPKVSYDEVFQRYRKVLQDGITIAGKTFSFLGFSHSSLRSHSAWFLAPFLDENFQKQTYEAILNTLGDFKDIRVPAKCAARIGQAFSETPFAIPLVERGIMTRYIPDVKSTDGLRVFSDGVGTISQGALNEIWPYLSVTCAPTCLQIRCGGVKGMVALDSRLKGKVLCIRKESMMKFPSKDDSELGVCDSSSKPLRLVLNRQMIKILEDRGTDPDWFNSLLNKALSFLRLVAATALNTSTFLQYQAIGTIIGLPQLIKETSRMKIEYRRDRFLKSVVEHVILQEVRLLKHKARIPVDKGVTLFGIMDETGFLEEGQVYITYDKRYGIKNGRPINPTLKDGPVIVTRSPALHPGDIQVVNMVTPPEGNPLLSLQNCIVFSQKGDRDLPSQLSGGDLDGDIYNIIWDPDAFPLNKYDPASYPRVTPEPLPRPVTRDDIADFFINFMRTDILGLIATRHVIIADKEVAGTMHNDCIKLAEKHSTAVDFSKTGIAVDFMQLPRAPKYRPDFLAPAPPLKLYDLGQIDHIADSGSEDDGDGLSSAKPKYYRSEKILGKLYRSVDEKKIWDEDIHTNINMEGPSVWDQLLGLLSVRLAEYDVKISYEHRLQEAWGIRNVYDTGISGKMWQFSDNPRTSLSEVEVFCGFILNKRGGQTRRQRDSSIKLKEDMDRFLTWIVTLIRDRGDKGADHEIVISAAASEPEAGHGREEVIELCWACVMAGCATRPASSDYQGTLKLESFRVVAACCLLKEVNSLLRVREIQSGGGYLGARQGKGRTMILPVR